MEIDHDFASMHRAVARGRRRWLEAGATDLTADNYIKKITRCHCYDLNDRGRMEIDHVFASMHRATGDLTRAWWRVQPRLLTQKRGQFLHHLINQLYVNYNPADKLREFTLSEENDIYTAILLAGHDVRLNHIRPSNSHHGWKYFIVDESYFLVLQKGSSYIYIYITWYKDQVIYVVKWFKNSLS